LTINTARFGLITNEFRFSEAYNSTTDTRYSKARELEIPSHLDLGLISGLLTAMFAVISPVRRRFIVDLKGTDAFSINDFAGQVPARYLNAPEVGAVNLQVIVTRAQINEEEDTTTIEVWG
jgi:hypothetical protein